MRIDLQIGGYAIRMDEPDDHPCLEWPYVTFDPFVKSFNTSPDIDLTVRIVPRLPEIAHGPVLYDACHGLWKLHATEAGGHLLISPDTSTLQIGAIALLSEDFTSAEVWAVTQHPEGRTTIAWTPMEIITPIVEACLLTKLGRAGGLLLHGAGVAKEQGGLVFTGASGAGKSTVSDFYSARGVLVLNDERLILRTIGEAIHVFGTPWPGSGRHAHNEHAALTALFCISHGKDRHVLRRMSPHAAVPFILQQCLLPHWDRPAMDGTLAFLERLLENVDCFDLAFLKNPNVVEFLEEQRTGRALTPS